MYYKINGFICLLSGIALTQEIQSDCGPTLREFKEKLKEPDVMKKLTALREEVEKFALQFPLPGHENF